MADTKVSALTSASVVNSADYLMLVQSGNSLKVDIATLAAKMPVRVSVIEASETLTTAGVVATNILVTKIALGSALAYTLAAGTHGMEKQIFVSSGTGTAVLTVTSGLGVATVTFNLIGDTVNLKNIDGSWYVLGSNSVVIA